MTTLLLLPGMMCDSRMWAPQISALQNQAMTVVPDLGRDDTIRAMAASVLVEAPRRFSVAGLSMGGMVAMEMWRQAPGRIERLALLDTNAHADLPERARARQQQLLRVRAGRLAEVMREELKPVYRAPLQKVDSKLEQLLMDMALDLGPEVFERQSHALALRPDSMSTLPGIDCPTLVLCGAQDVLCPVEEHRRMARAMPGAELVVVPDCGHIATLERPLEVFAALSGWLSRAA